MFTELKLMRMASMITERYQGDMQVFHITLAALKTYNSDTGMLRGIEALSREERNKQIYEPLMNTNNYEFEKLVWCEFASTVWRTINSYKMLEASKAEASISDKVAENVQ